jgi:hypothetical protein
MAELEINNAQELNEKLNEITKDSSLNKPSEKEVEEARKEFEDAAKEWGESLYKIGEPKDALEIVEYLRHFLRNRFIWQKEAWMGVIKLTEELGAAEILFKGKKDKGLELGYQALEFIYYVLTNPGGIGLQSALDFESENKQYLKILEEVAKQLDNSRKRLKEIEFRQQKWGAMAQGFYLEIEPGPEEDEKKDEQKNEDLSTEK